MMEKLLNQRKIIKSKKPAFRQQDSHKRKELKSGWRRARGIHSKIRLRKRGYPRRTEIGYGSPKGIKHRTRLGLMPVLVSSNAELHNISEDKGIVIKSAVGRRKKVAIIKAAAGKGLTILNFKDPEEFVKRTLEKAAKAKRKKEKKDEKRKKAEKTIEEKLSEEDKRKKEKKEMEKIVTKRV